MYAMNDWTEDQFDGFYVECAAERVRNACADLDRVIANHLPRTIINEYARRVFVARESFVDARIGWIE